MAFTEIQIERGTVLSWRDSGGDYAITLNALGLGTGRQGAVADLDAVYGTTRNNEFYWRAFVELSASNTLDEAVAVYAKTGNGTLGVYDNDDGTGDIAVSSQDKLWNLERLGWLWVDKVAAPTGAISAGGIVELNDEDFMPVFWNFSTDNFEATNNLSGFDLWPVPSGGE